MSDKPSPTQAIRADANPEKLEQFLHAFGADSNDLGNLFREHGAELLRPEKLVEKLQENHQQQHGYAVDKNIDTITQQLARNTTPKDTPTGWSAKEMNDVLVGAADVYSKATGNPAAVIGFDMSALGSSNNAIGRDNTDLLMRIFGEQTKQSVDYSPDSLKKDVKDEALSHGRKAALPVDTADLIENPPTIVSVLSRRGGDEPWLIVAGENITPDKFNDLMEVSLANSHASAQAFTIETGTAQIFNTKYKDNPHRHGACISGGISTLGQGKSGDAIQVEVDAGIDPAKDEMGKLRAFLPQSLRQDLPTRAIEFHIKNPDTGLRKVDLVTMALDNEATKLNISRAPKSGRVVEPVAFPLPVEWKEGGEYKDTTTLQNIAIRKSSEALNVPEEVKKLWQDTTNLRNAPDPLTGLSSRRNLGEDVTRLTQSSGTNHLITRIVPDNISGANTVFGQAGGDKILGDIMHRTQEKLDKILDIDSSRSAYVNSSGSLCADLLTNGIPARKVQAAVESANNSMAMLNDKKITDYFKGNDEVLDYFKEQIQKHPEWELTENSTIGDIKHPKYGQEVEHERGVGLTAYTLELSSQKHEADIFPHTMNTLDMIDEAWTKTRENGKVSTEDAATAQSVTALNVKAEIDALVGRRAEGQFCETFAITSRGCEQVANKAHVCDIERSQEARRKRPRPPRPDLEIIGPHTSAEAERKKGGLITNNGKGFNGRS